MALKKAPMFLSPAKKNKATQTYSRPHFHELPTDHQLAPSRVSHIFAIPGDEYAFGPCSVGVRCFAH
ncbi:hypothetical protein [Hyphomicrobium sp.]|uniref:hypothetical protein n=1 Tax=Hyphomicrobium sp. TaxID=82 RepID=UPI003F71B576